MKNIARVLTVVLAGSVLAGCGVSAGNTTLGRDASPFSGMASATGTKRAFLVGINKYMQPGSDLRGCVNDIVDVKAQMLTTEGFNASDIVMLTDKQATRQAMLQGLQALVASGQPGDFLYFHYSGHGAQIRDTNGDEPDGMDEILCPTDLSYGNGGFRNAIVDDEIQTILGGLKPGVGFLFVSDSCNSGTIDRNPNVRNRGIDLNPNWVNQTPMQVNTARMKTYQARLNAGKYHVLTGCQDDQTSADAYIGGRYNGAMTYYMLDTYKKGGNSQSYGDWHKNMVSAIARNGYDQRPNLTGPTGAKIFSIL